MEEILSKLLEAGWNYVAKDKGKSQVVWLYQAQPRLNSDGTVFEVNGVYAIIPDCLFPELTFKGSPYNIKEMLELERQKQSGYSAEESYIQSLVDEGYEYIVRDHLGVIRMFNAEGLTEQSPIESILGKHVPVEFEKVLLKSLLPKKKVKKSLTVHRNEFRELVWQEASEERVTKTLLIDLPFFRNLKVEHGEIELFYEMEVEDDREKRN